LMPPTASDRSGRGAAGHQSLGRIARPPEKCRSIPALPCCRAGFVSGGAVR
jgi:hypothetical protein